jgi:hypothetical protein
MWIIYRFLSSINRGIPLILIAFSIDPSEFGLFGYYLVIAGLACMVASLGGSGRWHRVFILKDEIFREKQVKANIIFQLFSYSLILFITYKVLFPHSGSDWFNVIICFIFLKQSDILQYIYESERMIKRLLLIECVVSFVLLLFYLCYLFYDLVVANIYFMYIIPHTILFIFMILRFFESKTAPTFAELVDSLQRELFSLNTFYSMASAVMALIINRTEVMLGKYLLDDKVLGSLVLSASIMGFLYNFSTGSVLRYLDIMSNDINKFTTEAIHSIKTTFWILVSVAIIGIIVLLTLNPHTEYPYLVIILACQISALPFHFLSAAWGKKYSLKKLMKINFARNAYKICILGLSFVILIGLGGPVYAGLALPVCYIIGIFEPDLLMPESRVIARQRLKVFL